ncbi:MAG TPA: tyrosine-type recombinase/integrase [Bacteroidia bacterium]|nr:tyrosine-type recombinase/integrase [Bacteroidia bacterium]
MSPTLIKLPRVFAKSHRAITENEFESIIERIPLQRVGDIRDSLIIRLLWDTGMRVSELTDMELSQINLRTTSAQINTKKTGYKRTVVWSEKTHELLMRYIDLRNSECEHSNTTALFLGWKNGVGWCSRLTPRTIERNIKRYAQDAGIREKVTPHSFRHGFAHKRRDMNAPLAFIQKALGHMNPISTFVYEQYKDADFERSARTYLK